MAFRQARAAYRPASVGHAVPCTTAMHFGDINVLLYSISTDSAETRKLATAREILRESDVVLSGRSAAGMRRSSSPPVPQGVLRCSLRICTTDRTFTVYAWSLGRSLPSRNLAITNHRSRATQESPASPTTHRLRARAETAKRRVSPTCASPRSLAVGHCPVCGRGALHLVARSRRSRAPG